MAVAAADFYTYARATGTPLPQSKKEEAQLAPAVDKWKKSRLVNKFTESKEDYIQRNDVGLGEAAGLTAALAGIGASVVAARNPNVRRDLANLVRPGKAVSTNVGGIKQDLNVEPVTIKVDDAVTWDDVKQRSTPNYEVVEKGGAGVRSDFTQPVVEKEVKTFSPYDFIVEQKAVDPETAYVTQRLRELQTGPKDIETKSQPLALPTATTYIDTTSPEQLYVQKKLAELQTGPKALESLADEQIDVIRGTSATGGSAIENAERRAELNRQARMRRNLPEEAGEIVRKNLLSDQSINAIDAAEDQETGRVVRQLQRNEDLDQNQIALMEEIAEDQDRRFGQALESGEIGPGKEYQTPIDSVAQSLPDGPPVIQSEQRVGLSAQPTAQQFLDKTKGEIIKVQDTVTGEVRYAETRPQPSWVGAKSDIYTGTPTPGPNLAESPIGQSIATERDKIIAEQKAMGIKRPKPSEIETELASKLGKDSYSYGRSYTDLKNKMKLGIEDPRFLTDLDQETKYVGGVELPIAVRNVFDNTATGSRQIKEPYIREDKVTGRNILAEKAEQDFIDTKSDINTYWGNAKVDVYGKLNPLIKQTDELLEEQNMLLYSLNNQGPSRELSQRLGLVNKELKTNQDQIAYLERRLSGIEKSQASQLENTTKWVPKTLTDWRGEGTVVRPKPQLARNKEIITDEGDALTSLNQATQRVTDIGPEDLEIVPGGLLTGGYPKAITNVPKTDIYTGAVESPIQIASGTSIRGMGGTDLDNKYVPLIQKGTGGDFVSKYIGKNERTLTRGGNILPNTGAAKNVPSGSLVSYRKPAGQRKDNQLNIAVTGGRTYDNYTELSQSLDQAINQLNPAEGTNINIIAGGAKGADALAERYAKERNYGLTVKPADWDQYGDAAGPIRNKEMAELADVGVAFEGGKGTRNMIKTMEEQGKPLLNTAEIQEATPARRLSVQQSEVIRKLSDPNWLTSKGVDLNKTTPQEQVALYLKSQGITQTTPSPSVVQNEYVNLRGNKVEFKPETESRIVGGKFETPLQWLEKRKRKN